VNSDYLKLSKPNCKVRADYVFLSPPWGGLKYKDSQYYSIRELVTPNIIEIVKTSLIIAKNIIFYLPRTLLLEELFDIVYECANSLEPKKRREIFFDVHVLNSAKKIKAVMIIVGVNAKEVLFNLIFS
jgi:hypothetical protein